MAPLPIISAVIVGIAGALVGEVTKVRPHPGAIFIWLAHVDLSDDAGPLQIVFGGKRKLRGGELVAVAPPGSFTIVEAPEVGERRKKMRVRRYRGERSHGMLCSLDELGWTRLGLIEVAVLCGLEPGQSLDDIPVAQRPEFVVDWEEAKLMERKRTQTALTKLFDPLAEPGCADGQGATRSNRVKLFTNV